MWMTTFRYRDLRSEVLRFYQVFARRQTVWLVGWLMYKVVIGQVGQLHFWCYKNPVFFFSELYLDVSKNSGFSTQIIQFNRDLPTKNHPFWDTPIFGNSHLFWNQKESHGMLKASPFVKSPEKNRIHHGFCKSDLIIEGFTSYPRCPKRNNRFST